MTDTTPAPECWCVYGTRGGGSENYGIEVEVPGCPTHDPANTAAVKAAEDHVCPLCSQGADALEECGSCHGEGEDEDGRCEHCGGSGRRIPEHCCGCGGSPYCIQCSTCKKCGADCRCVLTVHRADGTTIELAPNPAPEGA
jgi:hypothetical protein